MSTRQRCPDCRVFLVPAGNFRDLECPHCHKRYVDQWIERRPPVRPWQPLGGRGYERREERE